ncbi:MAG: tRNA (guanosine(46)-N7)-methyltransferase TrmB [Clostridia bacterium]|nr:tRNA (guanosine(46)-N7)-methyltransferase TrmB [Clostridia bacterium]
MRMRRKGHLFERLEECSDHLLVIEDDDFYKKPPEERINILDLEKAFGNNNPIEMEIGSGKGGFIYEMAKENPTVNFIAVEKISNVILSLAERLKEEPLKNLKIINCGAENLRCYITPHKVQKIYLNFSCPYPKKGYKNHRLTNERFLEIYKEILVEKGEIHQKTDNQILFEYSIETFSQNGFKLRNISLDLHKSDFEGNVMTEYEKMFSEKGFPIYRLEAFL